MAGQILDGRAIAKLVRKEVAVDSARFLEKFGRQPGLEVVLVGEDAASQVYVRNKERAAGKAGIRGVVHRLDVSTSQEELLTLLARLNADETVDGILVQLPVPEGLDELATTDAIHPAKDVDGLHPMNAGRLVAGRPGLQPCTPRGCMRLLEEAGVELEGKRAIVIGRSNLVGKPIAQMLLKANCTVTMAHSRTVDLQDRVLESDIVIAAVGRPRMIRGEWIKEGAVVIDVGINRLDDGKLAGDVDFDGAMQRASWVTPVPRGVGPMTIAMLLRNTVDAAFARAES